ncbi:MBL fold metallo-hydrolase [Arthrobacter bambusae]|uniref:MBL fold metallo-hydrolase n=1 Tax=Arthrobacter bambusae TaxID=1338426 RepID=UPI0027D90A74|nr:MBL fold metallo-hydrolase [Arthrobacter bambusae]
MLPGIIARPAPGHTPGSTVYLIHSEGKRALLLGDTVHTIGQLTEPEWIGMWDIDPVAASAMRIELPRNWPNRLMSSPRLTFAGSPSADW